MRLEREEREESGQNRAKISGNERKEDQLTGLRMTVAIET